MSESVSLVQILEYFLVDNPRQEAKTLAECVEAHPKENQHSLAENIRSLARLGLLERSGSRYRTTDKGIAHIKTEKSA